MNKLLYLIVLFAVLSLQSNAQSSSFVSVKKDHFYLNNHPYYYIGTNYWYGSLLGLSNDERGIKRLRRELDFLTSQGIYILRVLAGAEGSGLVNGVQRVGPPLQPEKGKFDEKVIESLDVLLYEMGKRNMKAVLYLSNNWEWSGGFLQYLRWNNQIPDSVFRRKLGWDEMRDYVSKFYTCNSCKEDYLKQVTYILSHTNKFSKRRYVDDPAIMAWELSNEPRPMRPGSNDAYKKWISNVAGVIKSKDHNHLITTGNEGEMGTENMHLFEDIHADKNIDYLTIHIWPKNWSWFTDTSIAKDFSRVISNSENYIAKHVAIAEKLQRPLVLEEFGLPRNNQLFDINSNTSLRDNYYNNIFSIWQKSKSSNGAIGGASFWAFGGIARPHPNQIFWRQGDDYMGDPPMEEQGLNTVFDSDSSTWKVINSYTKNKSTVSSINDLPADKQATRQTIALYHNLKKLLNKGIMLGHQDDLAYGVGWKYVEGKSDVKEVTNDYPAVYGFELGRLELDHPVNIDSVPFDKMKGYIRKVYDRGGVITLSWHLNNPLTGKTAWDPAPGTVASILSGGEKNDLYKSWLDKVADFLSDLKGKNGEYIPIIFRPFHELNGNWFWWGKDHCTPKEFKTLWHFTISYLRDTKHIHHLLYAYNTDRFDNKEDYLIKYPGDEWTDVVGFDIYQRNGGADGNAKFISDADRMLTMLEDIAHTSNKIPALTEFGYGTVPDSTWWTDVLWKALQSHKISYALAWRNAGAKANDTIEYYLPYKGQVSEKNFIKFYEENKTLFQKDITKQKLYQPEK